MRGSRSNLWCLPVLSINNDDAKKYLLIAVCCYPNLHFDSFDLNLIISEIFITLSHRLE